MDQENALVPSQDRETSWRPILRASNQVVLYNPTSHALTIHRSSHSTTLNPPVPPVPPLCPYCSQPLPNGRPERDGGVHAHEQDSLFANLNRFEDVSGPRASNYFQLLQVANDSASRPPSPPLHPTQPIPPPRTDTRPPSPTSDNVFTPDSMAEGYFKAFFQEEARLGMGANGSVFLCQVQRIPLWQVLSSTDSRIMFDNSMFSMEITLVNCHLICPKVQLTLCRPLCCQKDSHRSISILSFEDTT